MYQTFTTNTSKTKFGVWNLGKPPKYEPKVKKGAKNKSLTKSSCSSSKIKFSLYNLPLASYDTAFPQIHMQMIEINTNLNSLAIGLVVSFMSA